MCDDKVSASTTHKTFFLFFHCFVQVSFGATYLLLFLKTCRCVYWFSSSFFCAKFQLQAEYACKKNTSKASCMHFWASTGCHKNKLFSFSFDALQSIKLLFWSNINMKKCALAHENSHMFPCIWKCFFILEWHQYKFDLYFTKKKNRFWNKELLGQFMFHVKCSVQCQYSKFEKQF